MRLSSTIFAVPGLVLLAEAAGGAAGALAHYLPLFADATTIPDALPFKFDLNNMTPVGVLAWYAWHNAARVIPKMTRDNQEQVTLLTNKYMEHMRDLSNKFTDELTSARGQFEAMLERERQYHQEQSELLRGRIHNQVQPEQVAAWKRAIDEAKQEGRL